MTEKEEYIIAVLSARREIVRKAMTCAKERGDNSLLLYYEGKDEGYQQAIDLIRESIESINIELQ